MLGTTNNRASVLELGKALDGVGLREYDELLKAIELERHLDADGGNVENPNSRL